MDISKFEKVRFKLYLDFQLVIHSNLLFLKLGTVNQLLWWQRREIRFLDHRKYTSKHKNLFQMHFQRQNRFSNALPTTKPFFQMPFQPQNRFFKYTSNHKTVSQMHFQPQNRFSNRSCIIEELWCHKKSTQSVVRYFRLQTFAVSLGEDKGKCDLKKLKRQLYTPKTSLHSRLK